MQQFHSVSFAQEVIFGAGSLAQLGEAVAQFGWRRVLVAAARSGWASGQAARVEAALGDRLAATYEPVAPHVLEGQVTQATALAAERDVDAVLGLGGGSPIGLAKAVAARLEEQRTGRPARAAYPADQPLIPVIAVPTTYAGSEMTAGYGITTGEGAAARKVTISDPKIAPKLVVYDPALTLDVPPQVTAGSAMNALAHCVETVYSVRRNPAATASALAGARHIAHALPRCVEAGHDLAARTELMQGAHLAGLALSSVAMGLHHGLCHVLGGSAGVPHGLANAIVLPHAMRFNLETTAAELAQIAEALDVRGANTDDRSAAYAAVDAVMELVARLGLPQRLREVGVLEADLPRLAELAMQSSAVKSNPRLLRDAAEALALFSEMW